MYKTHFFAKKKSNLPKLKNTEDILCKQTREYTVDFEVIIYSLMNSNMDTIRKQLNKI